MVQPDNGFPIKKSGGITMNTEDSKTQNSEITKQDAIEGLTKGMLYFAEIKEYLKANTIQIHIREIQGKSED